MGKEESLIPIERIEQKIYVVRGERVMLDSDLAKIYGVETKMFNRAVKRNINRFPEDFMFQLTAEEDEHLRFQFGTSNAESLTSQFGTSKKGRGRQALSTVCFHRTRRDNGGEYLKQRAGCNGKRSGC